MIYKLLVAALGLALLAVALVRCSDAQAADPFVNGADPRRSEWFESLRAPGDRVSCCSVADGKHVEQDKVKQVGADWYVDLGNGFVLVPPDRIIQDKPSLDGEAYVFMRYDGTIRCFVRPSPGF